MDHLTRLALNHLDRRSPDGLTLHDRIEACGQCRKIEVRWQQHRKAFVEERALGRELGEEPDATLSVGQRDARVGRQYSSDQLARGGLASQPLFHELAACVGL